MGHKEEDPSYFDWDPAHQSLHPIVNSGLETNKTQRHATYFRERSKWVNWQMIQQTARLWTHWVHISAGRGRCQLLIVTKAIDCDLWAPTFRDSCKLCAVAQHGNTPPIFTWILDVDIPLLFILSMMLSMLRHGDRLKPHTIVVISLNDWHLEESSFWN